MQTDNNNTQVGKNEHYREHLITYKAGYYWALGNTFKTKNEAKIMIDLLYEDDKTANEMQEKYSYSDDDPCSFVRGFILANKLNNYSKLVEENRDLKTSLNHELEVHKKFIALQEREAKLVEENERLKAALQNIITEIAQDETSFTRSKVIFSDFDELLSDLEKIAQIAINNAKNL